VKAHKRKPEKIDTILKSVVHGLGWEKGLLHQQVIASWADIVGKEISIRTNPLRVRGSKLFVEVENSTWMNHLHYLKPEILKKLNEKCIKQKGDLIRDIVFRCKS
jgi:predicted nucleic acid-binding Zn ribbon protein